MKDRAGRDRLTFAAILFITVAIGSAALAQFQHSPFARVRLSDEESYTRWAHSILSGHLLPAAPLYQDPLYPYLLALWFAVAGPDPLLIRALQVLLGAAAVALAGLAGRQALGRWGGLMAAGLLAGCASLYYFELSVSKETLAILLSALSVWLGARAGDGGAGVAHPLASPRADGWVHGFPGSGRWLGLGLCFGLMCLTRGNFLLVAPLVAGWALLRPGVARRTAARQVAVFCAGLGLALAPVAGWNFHLSGEFRLTTYSGGYNFYLGNNPDADGGYVIPAFAQGDPFEDPAAFRAEAERLAGGKFSDPQAAHFWLLAGRQWLRENPAAAARLYARKIFLLLHQRELPNLYSLGLLRANFVRILWLPFVGYGFLWGPALLGAFVLRRRPAAQYAIVLTLGYALSLLPFFIVDRYRAPLLPALAVLAAGFFQWGAEQWRQGQGRKLATAAAAAGAFIVLGHWPLATPDALAGSERALVGSAYLRAGDPASALRWYGEARALAPDDGTIYNGWAASVGALGPDQLPLLRALARTDDPADLFFVAKRLEQLGQYRDAARAFEAAVGLDPAYLRACLHLAKIYSRPEMHDPARAAAWAGRALEIDPVNTDVYDVLDRLNAPAGSIPAK